MKKSSWRCPDCHKTLYLTSSARYWCNECQCEKSAEQVDPMARDIERTSIIIDCMIERELGVSLEVENG